MGGIRGTTVTLYSQEQTGTDDFGMPIYKETAVQVSDVLIGEPTSDEINTSTAMYGKKLVCILGIPKGDTNDWIDKKVEWTSCGHTYTVKTFGFPITGVEANIPMRWHMKVRCEQYG